MPPEARFERLYARHYAAVLAYAHRRGDVTTAQDVAADRRSGNRREALAARLAASTRAQTHEAPDGALAGALLGLSEHDREALMLVAWDGLTTAQAARVLGCSPVAMRVRLHRARRRLGDACRAWTARLHSLTADPAEEAIT